MLARSSALRSFAWKLASHIRSAGLRAAAATHPDSKVALSASTQIAYEDFPELFTAVSKTNWPPVVANENCQMPSTIGEDYRGPQCTGTVIAATDENNCQMPPNVGEDYAGRCVLRPPVTETTIVVQLNLTEAGSQSAQQHRFERHRKSLTFSSLGFLWPEAVR